MKRELQELGCSDPRIEVIHTTEVVEMNEHPVDAIRRKKDSSVSRAIDLVKQGKADADCQRWDIRERWSPELPSSFAH